MAKARSDAKFTEAKLKKVNEQIRYLGQYLSTKSVYGDFLKSGNKKSFRQAHAEDIAKYEEALRILKQHSPNGKFPTMKDLRAEKEQLTIQKDAQYDTYFLRNSKLNKGYSTSFFQWSTKKPLHCFSFDSVPEYT